MADHYWDSRDFTLLEERRRRLLRRRLLLEAIGEAPGRSEGDKSRIRYEREVCPSGVHVYVVRPARRNWGVDFTYRLDNVRGQKNGWMPSLTRIFDDIEDKVRERPGSARRLFNVIDRVFRGAEPSRVIYGKCKHRAWAYSSGMPIDALLALLKWVFIEQDLTYWHSSGRRRPMDGIRARYQRLFEEGVIRG